jgi:DNA-directed RNA polymerase specialized sigma subunit
MFENMDERDTCIFNLCTKSGKSYDEVADMMELSKDRIQKIVADRIKSKQK